MPSDAPLGEREGSGADYIIYNLSSRAQQIEPQSEKCRDISEHRLAEGRRGRAAYMHIINQIYPLEGSFCCDSEPQISSVDSSFWFHSSFYCM